MVAVTLPREEALASREAVAGGHVPWFPLSRRVTSRRGRRVVKLEPLFPNYLFVAYSDAWRDVFQLRGVRRLIMSGPSPVVVGLDDFRTRCNSKNVFEGWGKDRFRRGQSVTASRGAFAGVEGKYQGSDEKSETALFNFLGVERPISFTHGDLKPVA